MKLELEVGGTYRARNGERVEIVRDCGEYQFPMRGDNFRYYQRNGLWHKSQPELDLIELLYK